MVAKSDLVRISEYVWEVPRSFRSDMKVPARIYASEELLAMAFRDKTMEQLVNTAAMPGVVKWVLVMPDAHQGYGPPIGGVVPTRYPDGVISPGAVGYDIRGGLWTDFGAIPQHSQRRGPGGRRAKRVGPRNG